jgi:hypothetical protein
MNSLKIGRNDPCHCGSGLKYKKCCNAKDDAARSAELSAQAAARAQEAAAKAEAEAKAEDEEAEPASAKTGKGSAKQEGGPAAKPPRPKLPSHHTSLPRRGSV